MSGTVLDTGAVVLAGGTGSRLGPLGRATAKCLLPLAESETLMTRLVRQLRAAGIRDVLFCCSAENHAQIESALAALGSPRETLRAISCNDCSLGPLPALAEALHHVSGRWRLLCLADIYFVNEPFSIVSRVLEAVDSMDGYLLTGTDQVARNGSGSGAVACDGDIVHSISYRLPVAPEVSKAYRRWSGAYLFCERLVADLAQHASEYRHLPLETWIQGSLERGARCGWVEAGPFINLNSPEDYEFLVRTHQTRLSAVKSEFA